MKFENEHSNCQILIPQAAHCRKRELGQYFTQGRSWLLPQVWEFIGRSGKIKAHDPFAGKGHLLDALKAVGIEDVTGTDIDPDLGWPVNDSLRRIDGTDRIIVTNPPFRARNSATLRRLDCRSYFVGNAYGDLYLMALDLCLKAATHVVAIVPESFLGTGMFTDRLESATVLEDSPFRDTTAPVCVACFGPSRIDDALIYLNEKFIATRDQLRMLDLRPRKDVPITFDDPDGNVGLAAADGAGPDSRIRFCLPEELGVPPAEATNGSRHRTVARVDLRGATAPEVVAASNELLRRYRAAGLDLRLTPFMGNNNVGRRRRRLSFTQARAIIEAAVRSCAVAAWEDEAA